MRGRRYQMFHGETWLDIHSDNGEYMAGCRFLSPTRLVVGWTNDEFDPASPILSEIEALPLHTAETEVAETVPCGELLEGWLRDNVLRVLYNHVDEALQAGETKGLYWKYFTLQWFDQLGKELGKVLPPERVESVKAKITEMREKAKALGFASDKGLNQARAKRTASPTSKMSEEEKKEFKVWQKAQKERVGA